MNNELLQEYVLELDDIRIGLEEKVNLLQQENKQLKDNWNKMKAIAKSQSDLKLKTHKKSLWFEVDELLNKMQELESGDSNE